MKEFESNNQMNATQLLLKLFETSKKHVDSIIDEIPSALCIIDRNGTIMRGNNTLSKLYTVRHELLLGKNLSDLFRAADWEEFQNSILEVNAGENIESLRRPVYVGENKFSFIWSIKKLEGSTIKDLYTVMGQDVTGLENTLERISRLNHLFDELIRSSHSLMDQGSIEDLLPAALITLLQELAPAGTKAAQLTYTLPNRTEPLRQGSGMGSCSNVLFDYPIDWNGKEIGKISIDGPKELPDEYRKFILLYGQSIYLTLSHFSFLNEMEEKVRLRTKEIQEKNKQLDELNLDMFSLLDSLNEGYAVFDLHGKCLPISSRRLCEYHGGNPTGKSIEDVLNIPQDARTLFKNWFALMAMETLAFHEVEALAPVRWWPQSNANNKIQIIYHPIRNENKKLSRVAVVAIDRTKELQAQMLAEEERRRSKMILKIIQDMAGFNRCLSLVRQMTEQLKTASLNKDATIRSAHTLKANFRHYSWQEMAELLNSFETALPNATSIELESWRAKFQSMMDGFSSAHPELIRLIEKVGRELQGKSQEDYLFEKLMNSTDISSLKESMAQQFLFIPLTDIFEPILLRFQNRSQSMKYQTEIEFNAGDLKIYAKPYRAFFSSLDHLFNNIVDHAFVKLTEKKKIGKVSIEIKKIAGELHIIVKDNGSGIDLVKLKEKALKLGHNLTPEEEKNPHLLVFVSGLSTKEQVSLDSGRGVGQEIIAYEVKRLGGQLDVQSEKEVGTIFTFTLPYIVPKF